MNTPLIVKIKRLKPRARLPLRATLGATGFDLFACLEGQLEIGQDPVLVPTGIAIEAPPDADVQVRPRSGLSVQGVKVIQGTIDSDYRGEILVTMHTFGSLRSYVVNDGERIAQLVIARLPDIHIMEADSLTTTDRANRGHGSSGK